MGVEDFVNALKERQKEDEETKIFVELLFAVSDFHSFMDMMKSYKKNQ